MDTQMMLDLTLIHYGEVCYSVGEYPLPTADGIRRYWESLAEEELGEEPEWLEIINSKRADDVDWYSIAIRVSADAIKNWLEEGVELIDILEYHNKEDPQYLADVMEYLNKMTLIR